jgi:hypothetical protein
MSALTTGRIAVPAGAAGPGRFSHRRWLAPVLLVLACGDGGTGPDRPRVSALAVVSGNGQAGTAGESLADSLVVRATDAKGGPVTGVTVTWSAQSGTVPSSTVTGPSGTASVSWTLGTTAGPASVTAAIEERTVSFTAVISPGAVNAVSIDPATFTLDPGGERQVQAQARDLYGNQVTGRNVAWETTSPLVATVASSGLVRAVGGGSAQIRATLDGKSASATVVVTGDPAPVPNIAGITPQVLTPGITATITGTNLGTAALPAVVTVNGATATISSAGSTELKVTVPTAAELGCTPTAPLEVAVSVGPLRAVRPHLVRTATARTLGVGDELHSSDAAGLGCTELAANSGRYLLTVYNSGPAYSSSSQLLVNTGPTIQVRTGLSSGATPEPVPAVAAPRQAAPLPLAARRAERWQQHLRAHEQVMEQSRTLMRSVRLPQRAEFQGRAAVVAAAAVGDSVWIRFPDVSRNSSQACAQFDSVRARVVHLGEHSVVLEDITSPLAGQVDTLYQRMGREFDQTQYPLIRDNFGDPLVLDAQLNADGKLYMLYSNKVNGLMNGSILGFVWSGDFDDGTACPQSNRAEIFYGIVPTLLTGGTSTDWNVSDWYDYTRSTVVHEVKHVAAMAARRHNSDELFVADSMWLEEATAMAAEEIWARQVFGYQQRGNTGFEESVLCELNITGSGCAGMPLVMLNHFAFLYDYYEQPSAFSLLGRTSSNDGTFYGSAWAFLRWLTDHSGMPEAQFLTRLTQATGSAGLTTIEAVLGRSYDELLRDYVLAMALDDRPSFTTANARWSQPSWNTRDVFEGMSQLRTTSGAQPFPLPFPLVPQALTAPRVDVSQVRPGGAAVFEFQVPPNAAQAFEVLSGTGGALPPGLRVAILRVQ